MADNWLIDRPPASPYKAYLEASKFPLTSLVFIFPIFVLYHIGTFWISEVNKIPWANGADIFIYNFMSFLGIGGPLVTAFVLILTLLFMQQFSGRKWHSPKPGTLGLMFLESLLFAIPPYILGKLVHHVLMDTGSSSDMPVYVKIILAFGAGIYEEYLFRLVIMSLMFIFCKKVLKLEGLKVYVTVVVLQAMLFAMFHHLPGTEESLSWELIRSGEFLKKFAFRTLSGVYFAYLYQERGFGITVGSHAAYDVMAILQTALR